MGAIRNFFLKAFKFCFFSHQQSLNQQNHYENLRSCGLENCLYPPCATVKLFLNLYSKSFSWLDKLTSLAIFSVKLLKIVYDFVMIPLWPDWNGECSYDFLWIFIPWPPILFNIQSYQADVMLLHTLLHRIL